MSRSKDMWMDAVERVGEDFDSGHLNRERAVKSLTRLGFDPDEAATMIDERAA